MGLGKYNSIMGAHDNLTQEGYNFIRLVEDEGLLCVQDTDSEYYELWAESPHFAGFTLIHDDKQYEFVRNISYTEAHGRCDKCLVLRINGVVCHESGCPRQGE